MCPSIASGAHTSNYFENAGQGATSTESPWRTSTKCVTGGDAMGYDWNGRRERRMKIARFGTAVALAGLLVSMAAKSQARPSRSRCSLSRPQLKHAWR